jgi:hypothetical protein
MTSKPSARACARVRDQDERQDAKERRKLLHTDDTPVWADEVPLGGGFGLEVLVRRAVVALR